MDYPVKPDNDSNLAGIGRIMTEKDNERWCNCCWGTTWDMRYRDDNKRSRRAGNDTGAV